VARYTPGGKSHIPRRGRNIKGRVIPRTISDPDWHNISQFSKLRHSLNPSPSPGNLIVVAFLGYVDRVALNEVVSGSRIRFHGNAERVIGQPAG
jgi:hypothetical protein